MMQKLHMAENKDAVSKICGEMPKIDRKDVLECHL